MARDWFDSYGEPENKKAITERLFAKAGIGAEPEKKPAIQHREGSIILRKNAFLRGSTLTSLGYMDAQKGPDGVFTLTLWRCNEHPRLEVQTKIYENRMERTFLVDGEPQASLGAAAKVLAEREKASGIYPRPAFTVGDPEAQRDAG